MIQAKVLNPKLKASQAKGEPISLRPVIGIADEAGLERTLIDADRQLSPGLLERAVRTPAGVVDRAPARLPVAFAAVG